MKISHRHVCAAMLLWGASSVALAELPLTIEDLITDKGKVTLDAAFSYANSNQQGVATGAPLIVQTGPTSFITIPTRIGETRTDTDASVATIGLRYGLTKDTELYGRGSYLWNSSRSSNFSDTSSNDSNHFSDAWLGLNYRFLKDGETPALLGFIEVALAERLKESSSTGKSWLLGVTSYSVIDPVVLSFTAAYRFNQERMDGVQRYKPGNFLLLNPSLAFAVNDRVTLTGGVQWMNRQADRVDGLSQSFRRTTTDLTFGVAYGLSNATSLAFSATTNASGGGGSSLRINLMHTFDKASSSASQPTFKKGNAS
jgi:predicted porin